jgi:hypothetical protein
MPTGVRTRDRSASGDDGVVFDPALLELESTGIIVKKVAVAVAGEDGNQCSVATSADHMAFLQAAAVSGAP